MIFQFRKKSGHQKFPTKQAMDEAKLNPGGWVYEVQGEFAFDQDIPPQAIIGGWKVDENGHIIGDFIPNPNFLDVDT